MHPIGVLHAIAPTRPAPISYLWVVLICSAAPHVILPVTKMCAPLPPKYVLPQVSSRMEQDAAELEFAAHPALDALTRHINSVNLERVRRIKNKLARLLNNKVEKLKEILEGLLDDDSDLRDMNLTARRERERLEKERELEVARVLSGDAVEEQGALEGTSLEAPRGVVRKLSDPLGLRTSSKEEELLDDVDNTVEEVEMVLEPYFMRLDNTFNKLRSLTEYIDDTEVGVDVLLLLKCRCQ